MSDNDSLQASKGSHKGSPASKAMIRGPYKHQMARRDETGTTDAAAPHKRITNRRRLSLRLAFALALAFVIICYYLATPLLAGRQDQGSTRQASELSVPLSRRYKDILDCSGPYTPLIPTNLNYPQPRFSGESYDLSQVVILQRHTARYPVDKAYQRSMTALRKIERLPDPTVPIEEYIEKLESWNSEDRLGKLTDSGREIADRFGRVYVERYPAFTPQGLDDKAQIPFVRSSGSPRVIESGGFLLNALQGNPFTLVTDDPLPLPDVIFPTGNLSQDHNPIGEKGCQRGRYDDYHRDGTHISRSYLDSFSKLVLPHLKSTLGLRDGQQLEHIDIAALMSLCAFTSQEEASYATGASPSMWCDLFEGLGEEREIDIWRRYAYWYDVTKWYVKGQGNPATRNAGVGWINELIARLTDSQVGEFTDTNRTLDMDPTTFPRGGHRMFIDLSHDNRMLSILTAMGILHRDTPLPKQYDPLNKSEYAQGELSPFGMNLIVERFSPSSSETANSQASKPELVRILLNDVPVLPRQVVQTSKPGSFFMTVEEFVSSQAWASAGGDWTEYCAHDSATSPADEDNEDALELTDSAG